MGIERDLLCLDWLKLREANLSKLILNRRHVAIEPQNRTNADLSHDVQQWRFSETQRWVRALHTTSLHFSLHFPGRLRFERGALRGPSR